MASKSVREIAKTLTTPPKDRVLPEPYPTWLYHGAQKAVRSAREAYRKQRSTGRQGRGRER